MLSDPSRSELTPRLAADERVRQFEAERDLLQYTVDGWCVWPILRFGVAYTLGREVAGKAVGALTQREHLAMALKDVVALASLRPARLAVLVQSSSRVERQGELYKDFYFDDLLIAVGSFVKFENVVHRQFIDRNRHALIPSQLTTSYIQLLAKVLNRLTGPANIPATAQALSNCIQTGLGMETFPPRRIVGILRNFYWTKRLYRNMLGRIRPKYLLMMTAYSYYPIVAAAKELGIGVVEFQHGLIDRHHTGYSWTPYARPYKAHMPIPDWLFLYGQHWADELRVNGFWDRELHPVGSLRIDQYRQAIASKGAPLTLIVTTQNVDTSRLIAFLGEFLDLAAGQADLQLIIKLHPGESSKEKYLAAFGSDERVQVFLSSEEPTTFEWLTRAHFHASIYSTCHYEALGLGTPTIILPLTNHDAVLHLRDTGCAFLAETPQAMLDIILDPAHQQVASTAGENFFAHRALENMQKALGAWPIDRQG